MKSHGPKCNCTCIMPQSGAIRDSRQSTSQDGIGFREFPPREKMIILFVQHRGWRWWRDGNHDIVGAVAVSVAVVVVAVAAVVAVVIRDKCSMR